MNVRGLKHYYPPPKTLYRFFVPLKLNLKIQAVKIFKGEDTRDQVWGDTPGSQRRLSGMYSSVD
jgi:hypothetical protein